jgi:hypothetical protein
VVTCVREHVENGRTYLHGLVLGDPTEHYRREGLTPAARLEDGITNLLARDERLDDTHAATLTRVITAIIRISTTATIPPAPQRQGRPGRHPRTGPGHPAAAAPRRMTTQPHAGQDHRAPPKENPGARRTTLSSSAPAPAATSRRSAPGSASQSP